MPALAAPFKDGVPSFKLGAANYGVGNMKVEGSGRVVSGLPSPFLSSAHYEIFI